MYYVITKRGGGGQKTSIFDYVQYLKYIITKGREGGGGQKTPNHDYVIYG